MARTPLAGALEEIADAIRREKGRTRRQVLQDAGVAGLGLAAAATLGRAASASAASTSRVVVVGGGSRG